jgi:hypothetical protein
VLPSAKTAGTICKFADTIPKKLQMESCLQICKSATLQTMYLGGKMSPETAVFWPLALPAIGQGSDFLRKNRHLECWLRQQLPNSVLKTQGHVAWCC